MPRRAPPPAPPPATESAFARWRALGRTRTGRVLVRLGVASLAVLAAALVVRRAKASVLSMASYRVGSGDVQFVDLPPYADASIREGLASGLRGLLPADPSAVASRPFAPSAFAADAETRLRDVLARHPMVASVQDLDLRFPKQVLARATIRTPVVVLRGRWAGDPNPDALYDVPVDAYGVALDGSAYAGFLASHSAVVATGVRAACPGVGARWIDREDQVAEAIAAAHVANRLNRELPALGHPTLEALDVSAFTPTGRLRGRGEVVFRFADGRRVLWGRTERDLSGVTNEDPFEAKHRRLLDLLDARTAGDRRDLDVRYPLPAFSREPARRS